MEKLTKYEQIIKDNETEFNDSKQLADFINSYTTPEQEDITGMEDDLNEYADGLVPIYYYDIVKEWQENGDCHEMTLEVAGEYDQTAGIYKMMQSDLYFY